MFRFTTAGESHGRALVAIVEGLPAGMPVSVEQIDNELQRRQWGYGRGGRMKIEQDAVEILSGVRHGLTLGSPLALLINNKDWDNWSDVMAVEATGVSRGDRPNFDTAPTRPCRSGRRTKVWRARLAQHSGTSLSTRDGSTSCLWSACETVVSNFRRRDSQSRDSTWWNSRVAFGVEL